GAGDAFDDGEFAAVEELVDGDDDGGPGGVGALDEHGGAGVCRAVVPGRLVGDREEHEAGCALRLGVVPDPVLCVEAQRSFSRSCWSGCVGVTPSGRRRFMPDMVIIAKTA